MRDQLPPVVRDYLRGTPFFALIDVLPSVDSLRSSSLLTVLGERWWDTTHTFHWSWGELTITPEDVFALTGLPFGGEILAPNARRRITPAGLRAALGWLPGRIISDGIPHSVMVHHIEDECERVRGGHEMTRQEVRQLSRCYLLLIFHDFFCVRGGDNMRVWWLPYLRFFDLLYTHAWGGYVLAVLYESMDLICRHMELNHRGFTTLWDVIVIL